MFKHIGLLGPFHSQTIARSISNLLGYKTCRGLPPKLRSAKTQKSNLRRQTICEAYLQSPTDSLFPSGSESSLLLQFSPWHFTADGETFTTALMERPKVTMNLATNEHHYRPFVKNRSERESSQMREWNRERGYHHQCFMPGARCHSGLGGRGRAMPGIFVMILDSWILPFPCWILPFHIGLKGGSHARQWDSSHALRSSAARSRWKQQGQNDACMLAVVTSGS